MKKLKKNKTFSIVIIVFIYIIAALIGILISDAMKSSLWVNLLCADLVATFAMFIFSSIFKNASIYSMYWGFAPVVMTIFLACSQGLSVIRFAFLLVITVWGVRFCFSWFSSFRSLSREKWIYKRFRRMSGSLFPVINFSIVHIFPAIISYLCLLPVIIVFSNETPFSWLSIVFILIAIGAVVIETYADYHLRLFKKDEADGYAAGCCRYGLWRNSRHPGYFGEIIFWWAIFFAVVCVFPDKWFLFFGALLNTLGYTMFNIPFSESRLKNKSGYQRYKKLTHLLIPLKKKVR